MIFEFLAGTALSLFGIGQAHIGGIRQGKTNGEILRMLELQQEQNNKIEKQIIKLSDNILYNPNAEIVKDTTKTTQQKVDDLRIIRQQLEPVQKGFGNNILASSMISTPKKLQEIFGKNPYEVLIDIRQLKYAQQQTNPSFVPVVFEDNGTLYVGWQTKGVLHMFNCEYDSSKELWIPNNNIIIPNNNLKTNANIAETFFLKSKDNIVWQDNKHGIFTDIRDNKKYKVVKIGSQIWFAENLNYTQYIPQITNDSDWDILKINDAAYCYYDYNQQCGVTYGALYTYVAAKKSVPNGWHLPTEEEIKKLFEMKENYANFVFGGLKWNKSRFYGLNEEAYFWSIDEYDDENAYYFYDDNYDYNTIVPLYYSKNTGLSVRLLKD